MRSYPGAAGTVVNNLVALGVGRVCRVAVIGDDGEGYELRQTLLRGGCPRGLCACGAANADLHQADAVRRRPAAPRAEPAGHQEPPALAPAAEEQILRALDELWPQVDGLLVLDQVSEPDCGVITRRVRDRLAELGEMNPDKFILADSRERIGLFRSVWLKPNQTECTHAIALATPEACAHSTSEASRQAGFLHPRRGRHLHRGSPRPRAYGRDSRLSGQRSHRHRRCRRQHQCRYCLCPGRRRRLATAAAFGNLIASITIQQLGTTGTAHRRQVRERWQSVRRC